MLSTIAGIPIAKVVDNKKYKCINMILPDDKNIDTNFEFNEDFSEHTWNEDEFIIEEGKVEPFYDSRKERNVNYIFGPSGSGKSFYANKLLKSYRDLFPNNNIFVFSKLEFDPSLDNGMWKKYNRIDLSDESEGMAAIDDFNEMKDSYELNDSLMVFDDIDTITSRKLLEETKKFRDNILDTGRHNRISVICTSHLGCNGKNTKNMLNESHTITFFPSAGGKKQIIYFLTEYAGMKRNDAIEICETDSRWVTLHKHYPNYLIFEDGVKLLGTLSKNNIENIKRKIYSQ